MDEWLGWTAARVDAPCWSAASPAQAAVRPTRVGGGRVDRAFWLRDTACVVLLDSTPASLPPTLPSFAWLPTRSSRYRLLLLLLPAAAGVGMLVCLVVLLGGRLLLLGPLQGLPTLCFTGCIVIPVSFGLLCDVWNTTIQVRVLSESEEFIYSKILKDLKKEFNCNGHSTPERLEEERLKSP